MDLKNCARRVGADVVVDGRVRSRAGKELANYVNVKGLFGHWETREIMARAVWNAMDRRTTHIACMGYGGDIGVVVADRHGLDIVRVRDRPSGHGLATWLVGPRPGPGDRVTIIDDTLTTGGSIEETRKCLVDEINGLDIIEAIVVVKRGKDEEIESNLPIKYLFTLESFL